jgi:sarcosine oxidase, subunit alpha
MIKKAQLAIIGGGPAGLSAAAAAAGQGVEVEIFDDNFIPGGQLIKQTHKFFGSKQHLCGIRGMDIGQILLDRCNQPSININQQATVTGVYSNTLGVLYPDRFEEVEFESLVVATGASENTIRFVNNELPGIYGAGAIQTLMNVFGIKPAQKVLMVGSGNIGLIVSYQLKQAEVEVDCIVEALPQVGGYQVHASKIQRMGIPILTRHTIIKAEGNEEHGVTGVIISEIDQDFRPVPGTEQHLSVDTICLAVGLTPLADILEQAGCKMATIKELGGRVAVHNHYMQTSRPDIFLAGDVSGIEEAVTATLEGKLAGFAAAKYLEQGNPLNIQNKMNEILLQLNEFREGPFGEKARYGSQRLLKEFDNE